MSQNASWEAPQRELFTDQELGYRFRLDARPYAESKHRTVAEVWAAIGRLPATKSTPSLRSPRRRTSSSSSRSEDPMVEEATAREASS